MATYNNNPARRAIQRIIFDVNNINNETEKEKFFKGSYFSFNTEGDKVDCNYNQLIVGPEDSPYVGGFFCFKAKFPDNYPYYPMTMKIKTQGGNVRQHPNLYTCGKCCFSLLGTWQGPPWSACQNPNSIASSIRSVLINNPIVNEPGWENKNDKVTQKYENIIRYYNLRYAVYDVVKFIENGEGGSLGNKFSSFKDIVHKHFVYNYKKGNYHKQLDILKKNGFSTGKYIKSPVYSFGVTIDMDIIEKGLKTLYDELSPKYKDPFNFDKEEEVVNSEEEVVNSEEEVVNSKNDNNSSSVKKQPVHVLGAKKAPKLPKEKAKDLPEGTQRTGRCGQMYFVNVTARGNKRWKLV